MGYSFLNIIIQSLKLYKLWLKILENLHFSSEPEEIFYVRNFRGKVTERMRLTLVLFQCKNVSVCIFSLRIKKVYSVKHFFTVHGSNAPIFFFFVFNNLLTFRFIAEVHLERCLV